MELPEQPVSQSICEPLWKYGLFAIDSELLVESNVALTREHLVIGGQRIPLNDFDAIHVVGAGKAGSGMSRGLLKALGQLRTQKNLHGLVSVPDPCVEELPGIELHGGRPAFVNEPTLRGVRGAQRMLEIVKSSGPRDLVICLISGGGSALAPLPVDGITLEAKQKMTRFLSQSGANIQELNGIRAAISQIKGGGLVRDFRGHAIHSLIISDVLGNPLDVIASGMTVPQSIDFELAHQTLLKFDPQRNRIDSTIHSEIENRALGQRGASGHRLQQTSVATGGELFDGSPSRIWNHIIGDNRTIVQAIANMARQLGYEVHAESAEKGEGIAERVAEKILNKMVQRLQLGPLDRTCLFISGGEPTVVIRDQEGRGGRNQHLALAFLQKLTEAKMSDHSFLEFVSLGTDGEDGPTDAAGASVNAQVIENARQAGLEPADFLARNDSYHFFENSGGLIKTGPTHTNVCDVRLLAIGPE